MAQLCALFANANSTGKTVFTGEQFLLYKERKERHERLPPEAASALLALHNDSLTVPLLLAAWPDVLAAAPSAPPTPATRAYVNAERTVWLIAPSHERGGVRAALAACHDTRGTITVHDIDRPLCTHTIIIPHRPHTSWLESRVLFVTGAAASGPET